MPWTFDKDRRGFSITNAGLIIHSDLWKNDNDVQYALFLNCASSWPRDHKRSPLVLPLQRVQEGSNKFVRSGTDRLRPWSEEEASRWKNHGKQDILITQRKRRETHNKPGFVVALHHPKEVSLKRVDYYNIEDGDHPQTDKRVQKLEAKNIENCVSNLEKHEVHVASKHSIIAVIELSRTQKFGVAVQPNRRSPVYGLRRLNSFRDHQELEKCFSSTEGKHCHTALSLDSQNRQIRVAMHPRPPQDRPKVAESFFAGEHIQEMVLEIVLEDLKKDEEPFYKASPVVKASSTPEVTPRKRPKITSPKFFKRRKKQSTSES